MTSDPPSLPDALREPVDKWLEQYGERPHGDALRRLVACSEFAGTLVLRDTPWFLGNVAAFDRPPDAGRLESLVESAADVESVKRILRRYRNRFMLHVLWREVAGRAGLSETLEAPLGDDSAVDSVEFDPPDLDRRFLQGQATLEAAEEALEAARREYCVFGKTGGPFLRSVGEGAVRFPVPVHWWGRSRARPSALGPWPCTRCSDPAPHPAPAAGTRAATASATPRWCSWGCRRCRQWRARENGPPAGLRFRRHPGPVCR